MATVGQIFYFFVFAPPADRILLIDGKKIGRSVDEYCSLAMEMDWAQVMTAIWSEVLQSIKSIGPEVYEQALGEFYVLGKEVFLEYFQDRWGTMMQFYINSVLAPVTLRHWKAERIILQFRKENRQ
jgi:hypothetical protein